MQIRLILILIVLSLAVKGYQIHQMSKLYEEVTVPSPVNLENKEVVVSSEQVTTESNYNYVPEKFTVRGTLKKEAIPEELQLGDYWYWLYFDEPYLLQGSALGYSTYVDKLQVLPPNRAPEVPNKEYDMDKHDGKRVEIYGYQSWGYAESSLIQAIAIVSL